MSNLYLARGPNVIVGQDLPNIYARQQQRADEQAAMVTENAYRDRRLTLEDRELGMREQAFGAQQESAQAARLSAQEQARARATLAEMTALERLPPAVQAQYVERQRQDPEVAASPFAQLPPDQAFGAMLRGLRAALGEAQVEAPVPFEQTNEFRRIQMEQAGRERLARMETANALRLEEVRQRGAAGRNPAGRTAAAGNVTEGERKAAALGTRLEGALRELTGIRGADPMAEKPSLVERVIGGVSETGANFARSSNRQQADAAQLDALDAALTLATGAAYTREQLENLRKSYFPQLGDSPATVAAKQGRFETIVQSARIAAGRAEPSINAALEATGGASGEDSYVVGQEYEDATGNVAVYRGNGQWEPR